MFSKAFLAGFLHCKRNPWLDSVILKEIPSQTPLFQQESFILKGCPSQDHVFKKEFLDRVLCFKRTSQLGSSFIDKTQFLARFQNVKNISLARFLYSLLKGFPSYVDYFTYSKRNAQSDSFMPNVTSFQTRLLKVEVLARLLHVFNNNSQLDFLISKKYVLARSFQRHS